MTEANDNDMQKYREAICRMLEVKEIGDPEESHGRADDILCDLLRSIGYNEIVDIFEDIPKWYA